ncbi:MAG: tetratricopeptide repeat-containing serine protease family protein [Kiritimatiellales bacterium]
MKNKSLVLFFYLCCLAFFSLGKDMNNLLQSAEKGDASAQYNLGLCYAKGDGIERDLKEAAKWYLKAAEQGNANAQFNLGCLFGGGKGVDKNYGEAVNWYRKAADQGDATLQYNVGSSFQYGIGAPQDSCEAVKWYRKAAEQGNVQAQYSLGVCYSRGDGVLPDDKEAVKWYRKAAEQGEPQAQFQMGCRYHTGKSVPQDYQEAVKWFEKAAKQDYVFAQSMLGTCFEKGDGVLQDCVEAYAWFSIVAMNGGKDGAKDRDFIKKEMMSSQIAAGQERAKELMAVIEQKKQIVKLPAGQVPTADIAPAGFGSGLMVNGGYVVTCWHVVDNAKKISVSCQGKDFPAIVVQKDAGNDIAILRVDGADAGATLSFADSVKLGAQVFTMGFPHPDLQGLDVKFTTGSISGLTGPGNTPVYYQISAPLQSGNSGGPLFDEYGNLVGIVAAKLDSLKMLAATGDLTQNVNYAIKSDYLVPLLKTVDGIKIQPSQTKPVNLLSLVEELKKSVVMIKVY